MSGEHRVSDADREAAVVRLRDASTAGRLTLEELSDRTGLAYEARTHGDLVHLTADLPAATAAAIGERRRTGWAVGVFAPVSRRGRWQVRGRTIAVSLFARCQLDFRGASFPHEEAVVVIVSLFGPVGITVPEQVDVDMSVIAVFAPAIERGAPDALPASAPRPRVRGFSLFAPVLLQHKRS